MEVWDIANAAGLTGPRAWMLTGLAAVLLALLLERAVLALLRTLLGRQPLSGEEADCHVYHRNPWALDRGAAWAVLGGLILSGSLAAAVPVQGEWLWAPALLLWLGALALDLWTWERVACGVHAVAWRRGWRKPLRRVAVAELRGVRVTRGHAWGRRVPEWLQPGSCRLALELTDGTAVELPRTAHLFGGREAVQQMARFLRLQIEEASSDERLEAGARRAAARRKPQPQPERLATPQVKVSGLPLSVLPWAEFGAEPQ